MEKVVKRPVGRPKGSGSKYTKEIGDYICGEIAKGITLSAICRGDNFPEGRPDWLPERTTVYAWEFEHPNFAQQVARARFIGHDAIADENLDIADALPQYMQSADGSQRIDPGYVAWAKNRIDTRLKLLACWSPRYCPKNTHEVTGKDGSPLMPAMPPAELPKEADKLAELYSDIIGA